MSIEVNATPTLEGEIRDLSNCIMIDKITPQMLLEDLKAGRSREEIRLRYAYLDEKKERCELEKWMVDKMFQDPLLVGKKPAKVKRLPFEFVASAEVPTEPVLPTQPLPPTEVPQAVTDVPTEPEGLGTDPMETEEDDFEESPEILEDEEEETDDTLDL